MHAVVATSVDAGRLVQTLHLVLGSNSMIIQGGDVVAGATRPVWGAVSVRMVVPRFTDAGGAKKLEHKHTHKTLPRME
jgi:hypothetical protein